MCPGRALGLAWKGHLSVRGYLGLGLGPARMWAWLHVKPLLGLFLKGQLLLWVQAPTLFLRGPCWGSTRLLQALLYARHGATGSRACCVSGILAAGARAQGQA